MTYSIVYYHARGKVFGLSRVSCLICIGFADQTKKVIRVILDTNLRYDQMRHDRDTQQMFIGNPWIAELQDRGTVSKKAEPFGNPANRLTLVTEGIELDGRYFSQLYIDAFIPSINFG